VSSLKTGQIGWKCGLHWELHHWELHVFWPRRGTKTSLNIACRDYSRHIYDFIVGQMFTLKVEYGFISRGPQFVRQKCSFCRVLSIGATSARDNRLGVLEHTKLSWTHIVHAEVGGVTDGRYWVGTNPTTGGGHCVEEESQLQASSRHVVSYTEEGCALYDAPARHAESAVRGS
jgi:hypothetical protein